MHTEWCNIVRMTFKHNKEMHISSFGYVCEAYRCFSLELQDRKQIKNQIKIQECHIKMYKSIKDPLIKAFSVPFWFILLIITYFIDEITLFLCVFATLTANKIQIFDAVLGTNWRDGTRW